MYLFSGKSRPYGDHFPYVDDILIIRNKIEGINMTNVFLSSNFKMKDLGKVDSILGIKVRQCSKGFCLSQTHYIENMLNKFSNINIKEVNTPINPRIKLEPNMS